MKNCNLHNDSLFLCCVFAYVWWNGFSFSRVPSIQKLHWNKNHIVYNWTLFCHQIWFFLRCEPQCEFSYHALGSCGGWGHLEFWKKHYKSHTNLESIERAAIIGQEESIQCQSCICDTHLLRSVIKLCELGRLDKQWFPCGKQNLYSPENIV